MYLVRAKRIKNYEMLVESFHKQKEIFSPTELLEAAQLFIHTNHIYALTTSSLKKH